jgi:hypothetical protein
MGAVQPHHALFGELFHQAGDHFTGGVQLLGNFGKGKVDTAWGFPSCSSTMEMPSGEWPGVFRGVSLIFPNSRASPSSKARWG